MASPIAGAAMAFDLYCRRYGQDRELLVAIPLAFRAHAASADDAIMRAPISEVDYRTSRSIVDPLRLLDCSPVGDGAVCLIVGADGGSRDVRITGAQGLRAGRDTFIFAPVGLGFGQQSQRRLTRAEAWSQRAYAMAAATPETIDLLGIYNSFSPLPLYVLEDFGFCGEGEALSFVQGGRVGEVPVIGQLRRRR